MVFVRHFTFMGQLRLNLWVAIDLNRTNMLSYKSVKVFTMISILCILLFLSVELYFRNGFVAFWRRDHDGFTDASFCDTASWLWCVFEAISHVNRSRRVCEHAEKVTAKVCVHSRTMYIHRPDIAVRFFYRFGRLCVLATSHKP